MNYQLIIRSAAEADIEDAHTWYVQLRELGTDFLTCVEESLEVIRRNPELFAIVHKDVRRAIIRRFPYGVFYRLVGEAIVVVAVMHARRDPRRWQERN